jgi:hypothetical protein
MNSFELMIFESFEKMITDTNFTLINCVKSNIYCFVLFFTYKTKVNNLKVDQGDLSCCFFVDFIELVV